MSFESISIIRSLPIINNKVIIPNSSISLSVNNCLNNLPGSEEISLSLGIGPNTGSKFGSQRIFNLPPINALSWYDTDPVQEILN